MREFSARTVLTRFLEKTSGGPLNSEASKATARSKEKDTLFKAMEGLKRQVDDANDTAAKKFDKTYDKLFESGVASAKVVEKLLKKYEHLLKDEVETDQDAAVKWMGMTLDQWRSNEGQHERHARSFATAKIGQALNTAHYGKIMDEAIVKLNEALSG